ncbi:Hypothetical protein CINCED_3A018720 [Cinara cedri]|uniref:Uncharacterized protein n=1 Tax=Cinara cedri TaxID=506608 RepID=A0A5E4NAX1_9HEMI|nr:Hypothetical protein CINCED_3A018720 [Cinara cedri]
MPKQNVTYVTQIKIFATTQLAKCSMNMQSTGNLLNTSPLTSSYSPMLPPPSQPSANYSMTSSIYLPHVKEERGYDVCEMYGPQYIESPLLSSDKEDLAVSKMEWGLKQKLFS